MQVKNTSTNYKCRAIVPNMRTDQSLREQWASRIRNRRERLKWSQQKLAERSGVSLSLVSKFEAGKTGTRFTFKAIMEAMR